MQDMKLQPMDQDRLQDELLVKFEVASSYLHEPEEEQKEQKENITDLNNQVEQIKALFEEMQSVTLQSQKSQSFRRI